MSRKTLIVIAVLAALLLTAGTAIAVAVESTAGHYGPVTVIASDTSDFTSTGTLIAGWYWLRDSGLTDQATWKFSDLPTTKGVAKGNRVYLRFSSLVTNKASGGSGYNATVWVSYVGAKGKTNKRLVTLRNLHPEIVDARDTSGWGYEAYGYLAVPVATIPTSGDLTVVMKRGAMTKRHVAANADACTVEYVKP